MSLIDVQCSLDELVSRLSNTGQFHTPVPQDVYMWID